jgi:hypothetical protein
MSFVLLEYTFSPNLGAPVGTQVRFNAAFPYIGVQVVSFRDMTSDGVDLRALWLARIPIGTAILVQDKNNSARYAAFETIGRAIARTNYVDLPVRFIASGEALLNQPATVVVVPRAERDTGPQLRTVAATQLSADLLPEATLIALMDGSQMRPGWRVSCGGEGVLLLHATDPTKARWVVRRGEDGTTAGAHTAGTPLTFGE